MAKVIEFHITTRLWRPLKGACQVQFGKVIEFPSQTSKSA